MIKKLLATTGIVGVVLLVIAMLCIVPLVFLWALNSLAEAGGASFYVPHTAWNYLLAFVFVAAVRGS